MRNIKQELCYFMHKFVSEHIEELRRPPYEITDYKNEKQMLSAIKKNEEDAVWALTELCSWGLGDNFTKLFVADSYEDEDGILIEIFEFVDRAGKRRCFKVNYPDWTIKEVKKVTKMIEVTVWE